MLFDERLYDYADQYSHQMPDYLNDLLRETALTTVNPFMASGPVLGRFLMQISKWIKPSSVLEIGSFTGYSALCLAQGLPENGTITCIEVNEEDEAIIRKYFTRAGKSQQLNLIIGDALSKVKSLSGQFDLVLIDANKQHNEILYDLVYPLLTDHGTVLIDNTLWYGNVIQSNMDKESKAIHDFNVKLSKDERVNVSILPIRDGITLITRK